MTQRLCLAAGLCVVFIGTAMLYGQVRPNQKCLLYPAGMPPGVRMPICDDFGCRKIGANESFTPCTAGGVTPTHVVATNLDYWNCTQSTQYNVECEIVGSPPQPCMSLDFSLFVGCTPILCSTTPDILDCVH
jgi:hypothetical protein